MMKLFVRAMPPLSMLSWTKYPNVFVTQPVLGGYAVKLVPLT